MRTTTLGQLTVHLTGGTDREGGGDGPLVVLLHGFGAPGTDLVPLWRELRQAVADLLARALHQLGAVLRVVAPLELLDVDEQLALEGNNQKNAEKARNLVRDALLQIAPVFAKHKYMLGDEYSMLDVAITPLLWRLDYYGVAMPKPAAPLLKYAERLFSRPAFSEALTSAERGMRK